MPFMAHPSSDDRVLKVAVSPLSFGPATDKALASVLLRAIANAELVATSGDEQDEKLSSVSFGRPGKSSSRSRVPSS